MNFLLRFLLTLTPVISMGFPNQSYATDASNAVTVSVQIVPVQEKDKINYNAARPLSYEDFSGRPDRANPGVAATHSVISVGSEIQYNQDSFSAQITIHVFMDSHASWMKKEGRNPHVLAHEQLHFDISAYIACLMAEAIKNTAFTRENFKQQLKDLQQQYMAMREDMQQQYDQETRHGTIVSEQTAWAEKIKSDFAQHYCF